jgi:hypothetical protein
MLRNFSPATGLPANLILRQAQDERVWWTAGEKQPPSAA